MHINGDSIKIFEFLDIDESYLSYYDSLLLKHKNSQMIYNISFRSVCFKLIILHLPIDITGIEMKKSYLCKRVIPFKYYYLFNFIFNGRKIEDKEILKNLNIREMAIIDVDETKYIDREYDIKATEGKKIYAQIEVNDIGIFRFKFGTLNQIKELHKEIKNHMPNHFDGNAIIYPGKIEVKENDERTFAEIGIRDSFICKCKLK